MPEDRPPAPDPDDTPPDQAALLAALQLVFHPRGVRSPTGAANCLNALLQGRYFEDDASLSQLMGGEALDAYALNTALRPFDLSLEPLSAHRSGPDPDRHAAFLCFQHARWFALRRFGQHWINLTDNSPRPCQILPANLAVSLRQVQHDGCTAYIVHGLLPPCPADQASFFDTHSQWNLPAAAPPAPPLPHLPDRDPAAAPPLTPATALYDYPPCHVCNARGPCRCDPLSDKEDDGDEHDDYDDDDDDDYLDDEQLELDYQQAFEHDLQTAIAMSLAEIQPVDPTSPPRPTNKPLCIKTRSPPTSTVSNDPVDAELAALRLEDADVDMAKHQTHTPHT